MTVAFRHLTASGIASVILGKRVVEPKPATVGDLIEFVKSHPTNGQHHIRFVLAVMFGAHEADDLAQLKRRLTYQLPIMKAQIKRGHWAANPDKLSAACSILDAIEEFEGTA